MGKKKKFEELERRESGEDCERELQSFWAEEKTRGAEKAMGEGVEKGNEGGRKLIDLRRTRGAPSGMVCLRISYKSILIITTLLVARALSVCLIWDNKELM